MIETLLIHPISRVYPKFNSRMTPIEEIKSRVDLIDIVGETVELRKSGRSYTGFCPFHSNTKTPSFVVFPETQTWRCFGACADGGDLFSYIMKRNGWDFKETLENLAQRTGVVLEETTPQQKAKKAANEEQADLLEAAADYFHHLFMHAPQAAQARDYARNRGLTRKTVETYKVGYALQSWDACRTHFTGQGYTVKELMDAGMLTHNEDKGTTYDRFRNRLMVPIRDANGRYVGFGARTLDPDGIPKYLNSPQTDLFDKSRLLYGLDLAKRHIREAGQVVIVEGYMDVIQAWQGGFHNVVAQMGTALTPQQLQLLKRYTKRFVIALDADAAGVKATMRSLEVARQTLDRTSDFHFDPSGLVKEEGRLQADIRVVTMPEGEDPDSIVRHNPAKWQELVAKAKPVVEYVIGVLVQQVDLNDGKSKTAVAQKVIPLINDVSNPVEREHYWQILARTIRIDIKALQQLQVRDKARQVVPVARPVIDGTKKRKYNNRSAQPPPPPPPQKNVAHINRGRSLAARKREENFLLECLETPLIIRRVNRILSERNVPILNEADFSAAEDQALFRLINHQQSLDRVAPIIEMWDSLDVVLQQRIHDLQAQNRLAPTQKERRIERLVLSILDWRLEKATRMNDELKQLIHTAQFEANQALIGSYTKESVALLRLIHQINRAKGAMSATARRRSEDKV